MEEDKVQKFCTNEPDLTNDLKRSDTLTLMSEGGKYEGFPEEQRKCSVYSDLRSPD